MLCQYFPANFTSLQLHEMATQNVSQSNRRKAIKNNTFGPGPTVILLIGPLIENASLLLSRAGIMLLGL